MILQALAEYYDRRASDPESGIAPQGWERKEIPFVVVLDERGALVKIEDTREGAGSKKRARAFLVPQGEKKASGVRANLLWDTAAYVFGVAANGKPERLVRQKAAFSARIQNELGELPAVRPLLTFLESATVVRLAQEEVWGEIVQTNANVTFRVAGRGAEQTLCANEQVRAALLATGSMDAKGAPKGVCLVRGGREPIASLHTAIKGVRGAQSSGANIVSFNLSTFRSFHKHQGKNAPIGESTAFAYTTALNTLLGKDSKQKTSIGDTTTVFWSQKASSFENDFASFFSGSPRDDPVHGTRKVQALLESPRTGTYMEDDGSCNFYVLGLAPNAARIAIRFWHAGTIQEYAERIRQHFLDIAIVKSPREPEHYSLWRLFTSIAVQDKAENIPPNVAGDFMRAVLTGSLYPTTLLQATLRRIHADASRRVTPPRAALIKGYLNRYHRRHPCPNHKEILMELDRSQTSTGYRLGRLFAALEKIQEEASPSLNATIRERYYGSACSSPVTVFPNLMRLKNHHLAKMDNRGRVMNLERLLCEIMEALNDFPANLDLHEQGRFAIGYYHQRHALFTKQESQEATN